MIPGILRVGPRSTYPRNGSSTYHLALFPFREPGVAGSSPFTLTTSLVIPISSSPSSNGPTTTPLTTRGFCQCPGGSFVWADLRFVRPHWGSWIMVRFLGLWSPKGMWNPPPPMTKQSNTCLLKKYEIKKNRRRSTSAREDENPPTSLSFVLQQWSVQHYSTSQWACWPHSRAGPIGSVRSTGRHLQGLPPYVVRGSTQGRNFRISE